MVCDLINPFVVYYRRSVYHLVAALATFSPHNLHYLLTLASTDEMLSAVAPLNLYFRKFGKKDIHSYTHTPHSWANDKIGSTFWEVLMSEPQRVERFSRGLALFEAFHPIIGVYPFEEQLQAGNSPDRPFVVDIGGGRGLALVEMRKRLPSLQGKLVLQDRKEVLDSIPEDELPAVEKMEHDFFTEQPVKNAQIYYIRRVFHDWQDEEARKILQAIVPAMAEDSRILLSDMALPEPVGQEDTAAVWLDLMMMTIGGKERTRKDWVNCSVPFPEPWPTPCPIMTCYRRPKTQRLPRHMLTKDYRRI